MNNWRTFTHKRYSDTLAGDRNRRVWTRPVALAMVAATLFLAACGMVEIRIEEDATPLEAASGGVIERVDLDTVSLQNSTATAALPTGVMPPAKSSPTPEQTGLLGPTMVPTPSVAAGNTVSPAEKLFPTRTPYFTGLERSLYFLPGGFSQNSRQVWRLAPGAQTVEPLTPSELRVTSFSVWPADGRIAYGTFDGLLFVHLPGQEPTLVYDAGNQDTDPVEIDGLAWSPEGTRLAFTGRFYKGENSDADGLWLWDLELGQATKLVSNRHFDPAQVNVNEVRTMANPVWSPDGSMLLLTGRYWEWSDILLLDPVAGLPDESNLIDPDPEQLTWTGGAWGGEGDRLFLSGTGYSATSDLVQYQLESGRLKTLVNGALSDLYVSRAAQLPDGVAFTGWSVDSPQTRLYLGHFAGNNFEYEHAGPNRPLCPASQPRHLAWNPEGELAVVICDNSIWLISLDGSVSTDLSSFLGPLLPMGDSLKPYWGM